MYKIAFDIFSLLTASVIFSLLFLTLYFIEKKKYLLHWFLSWVFFTISILSRLLHYLDMLDRDLSILYLSLTYFSSIFLLLGVMRFLTMDPSKHAVKFFMAFYTVILVTYFASLEAIVTETLVFFASGAVYIISGIALIKNLQKKNKGGMIAGIAMIIWGIHKADYPFVKDIELFAHLGYHASTILTFAVAVGIMLMHYEKSRNDIMYREDLFINLAEVSKDIVFIVEYLPSISLKFIGSNIYAVTGYTKEEIIQSRELTDRYIFDFLMRKNSIADVNKTDRLETEDKNGKRLILEFTCSDHYNLSGRLEKTIGFARDVTDNMLAFDTIVTRQDLYEALFQKSHTMQLLINAENRLIVDANKPLINTYGYSLDSLRGMKFDKLFISRKESERFRNSTPEIPAHFRHITNNGTFLDVLVSYSGLNFDNNSYHYVDITNISKEVQVQNELRDFTLLNSAILKSLNEGVMGFDEKNRIFFINDYVARFTGYPEYEIIGRHPHELLHGHGANEIIPDHDCSLIKLLENRKSSNASYRDEFLNHIGRKVPVEVTVSRLNYFDEDKLIIIFRDISEKVAHEKDLMDKINENETLLQEVHHRVKNNLQIICSLLSLQTDRSGRNKTKINLNETISRIKSMALIHELLYQTQGLDSISMKSYMEKLLIDLKYTLSGECDIIIHAYIQDADISLDKAVPCGLIVTELFTNAIKHAFTSQSPSPTVEVGYKQKGDSSVLWVKDNGKGFDTSEADTQNSVGLIVVNSLVKQLKGNISYTNNNGTSIEIVMPN
jgi:PAS domain S-box-containing protein